MAMCNHIFIIHIFYISALDSVIKYKAHKSAVHAYKTVERQLHEITKYSRDSQELQGCRVNVLRCVCAYRTFTAHSSCVRRQNST